MKINGIHITWDSDAGGYRGSIAASDDRAHVVVDMDDDQCRKLMEEMKWSYQNLTTGLYLGYDSYAHTTNKVNKDEPEIKDGGDVQPEVSTPF